MNTQKKVDWDSLLYKLSNYRSRFNAMLVDGGVSAAGILGASTMHGSLTGVLCRRKGDSAWNGGELIDLGLLGKRVVTNSGVAMLVDYWDAGTPAFTNMNYHDSGTGVTAEAASQTDLVTAAGPTTRATGTKSQPSANILRSVGTISYTGTLAITEHGLFDSATRGGETAMWDRTLFAAVNVVNGDSIQFTYDCTLTAGS